MNREERQDHIQAFIEEHVYPVLVAKGTEYSRGEEDANSNFKRLSDELGLTPEQALWVYLKKHLDSIVYAIKTNNFSGTEPIEGRIGDAVNYLLILSSLIAEHAQEDKEAH